MELTKILLLSPKSEKGDGFAAGIAKWTNRFVQGVCQIESIHVEIVNTGLIGKRRSGSRKKHLHEEIYRNCAILINQIKKIKYNKPDIIHLNSNCSSTGLLRDLCESYISRMFKIPYVLHFHCNIAYYNYSKLAEFSLKSLVMNSSSIITLNSPSSDYVLNRYGRESKIIPLALPRAYLEDVRRIVIKDKIERACFVGHVTKAKGCDLIIEIAKYFPQIEFALIGFVFDEIRNIVSIPNNVSFLGNCSETTVKELLSSSDVFIFPSLTEGFPTAVLEAMAFGLPIVASDVGAIPDMLGEQNQGGIIVHDRNLDNYIQGVEYLNSNPTKRNSMSLHNFDKVRNEYSESMVLYQYIEIYNTALGIDKISEKV